MPENESASPRESSGAPPVRGLRTRARRLKTRRNVLLLLGVLVLVAIAGLFVWRHFSRYESTDDAQVDAHLHPVSARISGYVVRVNVEDNEYVRQGTLLVEIDPKDYEVAVEQARADLSNAVA